ncbi:MAG: hypothetical protein L0Y67_08150, partial [Gammaproteobacteria bacterium]|nr:hypothetical protein [Gammaproteobacteria bacterium]
GSNDRDLRRIGKTWEYHRGTLCPSPLPTWEEQPGDSPGIQQAIRPAVANHRSGKAERLSATKRKSLP